MDKRQEFEAHGQQGEAPSSSLRLQIRTGRLPRRERTDPSGELASREPDELFASLEDQPQDEA